MNLPPRLRLLAAGTAVAGVLWFGATFPRDPDFDATTVLEAWRPFGAGPLAVATALLLVLLAWDRAADAVARAVAGVFEPVPPWARLPLAVAAAVACFVTFTDVSLSGDALDIVRRTATNGPPAADPLTALVHGFVHLGLGLDAYEAVRWTSIAAGAVFVALACVASRAAFDDGPRRVAAASLLLGAGPVALFFGSVETYAPVIAATLAFLVAALRRIEGRGPDWLPPLLLGVACTLHGSAAFLVPSAAVLFLHDLTTTSWPRAAAVWVSAAAIPIAGTFAALSALGRDVTGPGQAGGEGFLLPLVRSPEDLLHRYAFLDAEHLVAAASVVFVCGPAAWALLAAGPASLRGRKDAAFLLAALVPLAVLPFVWNTSYTLRRDWDLFSVAGVPLALLAARACLTHRPAPRDAVRVATLAAFAGVPFFLSHHEELRDRRLHAVAVRHVLRTSGADAATLTEWSRRISTLDPHGIVPRLEAAMDRLPSGRDEASLREVLRLDPEDPHALRLLAEVLVWPLANVREDDFPRRRAEAEDLLRRSLLHPRENLRPPARRALARLLVAAGRPDEARAQLERLVREDSEHPEAFGAAVELERLASEAGDEAAARTYRAVRERMRHR